MNPEDYSLYFDEENHLNQKAQALYIDAMKLNRLAEIPKEIYEHAQNCSYCTVELYELYEALEGVHYAELGKHPWLDEGLSELHLSDKKEDLEAILQQFIADAVEIPTYEEMISETYRSQNIGDTLVVHAPNPEQLCTNSVTFLFNSNSRRSFVLTLENHQKRVYKAKLPHNTMEHTILFTPKEKFPSGLYYWKLALRGGNPMLMGKIYIYQK